MSRIFFLTAKETLPAGVAARMLGERKPEGGLLSFEDTMILTMTAQTGRRIVDRLALAARDEDAILLPPRTGTLAGLTKGQDPAVATPLQSAAAWVETTMGVDEEQVHQAGWQRSDAGGRMDLGLGLFGLAKETAKAGLTISEAAGRIEAPEDAERWAAWAELERGYLRRLKDRGKRCPQEAELARARDPILPEGITRVVLAGVVDASPLAIFALESLTQRKIQVEILGWTPGLAESEAKNALDANGRAQADFWKKKEMLAGVEPELRRDGADLALAAVEHLAELLSKKSPGKAAVVVDDAALGRDLAGKIEQAGGQAYLAAGRPLEEQSLRKLLRDLAEFCREGSFRSLDALFHHPDFLRWILEEVKLADGASRWLGDWSKWGYDTMEAGLDLALRMPPETATGSILPVLRRVAEMRGVLGKSDWPKELRALLLAILGDRELEGNCGEVEAIKSIDEALTEAESGTGRELGLAGWVELLGALGGAWTKEKFRGAVEIEGWLDAAGEDAEVLILAGMNEGLLPQGPALDAMLTESAKRQLGLPDRDFLQARDLCLLHGMEAGRKRGGLVVLTAQNGEAGEPLRPSRLLFRVPDEGLAARVEKWAAEAEPKETGNAREAFQRHKLRIPKPPTDRRIDLLRVTDFSAYLACPLRFYLSRRLGWRPAEEPLAGLDARRFGTWMHEVLGEFGNDVEMRACGDADKILQRVQAGWDAKFFPWEKTGELRLSLDLQREAGRERLRRFAEEQAVLVQQGWRIVSTETALGEERVVPGQTEKKRCFSVGLDHCWVQGRADRIDEHPDLGLRVVDYKTGKESDAAADHFAGGRKAVFGRSPEYARLVRSDGKGKAGPACWINLQLPLYLEGVAGDGRPAQAGYFYLGEKLEEIGWKPLFLSQEERESARNCAREVAKEVREDAVLDWIRKGRWERLAVKAEYDDFEELGLGRFIEEEAIEVAEESPG
jgi:ATP-dependent helicase/nuclease subunit B